MMREDGATRQRQLSLQEMWGKQLHPSSIIVRTAELRWGSPHTPFLIHLTINCRCSTAAGQTAASSEDANRVFLWRWTCLQTGTILDAPITQPLPPTAIMFLNLIEASMCREEPLPSHPPKHSKNNSTICNRVDFYVVQQLK